MSTIVGAVDQNSVYKTDCKLAQLKQLQFGHKAESFLKRQRFEEALAEDMAVIEQQLDTGLFDPIHDFV